MKVPASYYASDDVSDQVRIVEEKTNRFGEYNYINKSICKVTTTSKHCNIC